jgi:hypothetical protein
MKKLLTSILLVTSLGLFAAPASASTLSSQNWTGYAATGTITGVTGTFTVPYLTSAKTCYGELAIWVGVGGVGGEALLQAGVILTSRSPLTGVCSTTKFWVRGWWENLPAFMQTISPLTLAILPGDKVTVVISRTKANHKRWLVGIEDTSDSGAFVTYAPFAATAPSADYIVEAVTNKPLCRGICSLPPFVNSSNSDPGITFTTAKYGGTATGLDTINMANTTLSAITGNGFTVSYN